MRQRTGWRAGYRAAAEVDAVFTGTRGVAAGLLAASEAVADGEDVVATDSQQITGADTTV